MKKLLALSLIFFTQFPCIASSDVIENLSSYAEREWDFMEEIFINRPRLHKKINNECANLLNICSGLTGIALMEYAHNRHHATHCTLSDIFARAFSDAIACGMGIGLATVCIVLYEESKLFEKTQDQCKAFIAHWPQYKQYTPACFHESFESLFILRNDPCQKKEFDHLVKDLTIKIITAVYNHYPEKYYRPEVNNYVFVNH